MLETVLYLVIFWVHKNNWKCEKMCTTFFIKTKIFKVPIKC